MNFQISRMIPPVRRPQIVGVVAVLVFFTLLEFMVAGRDKVPTVSSNQADVSTTH